MMSRWLAASARAASCWPLRALRIFSAKTCATDSDCGSLVCETSGGQAACVSPASASIHVGMSAPISGPNQELGTDMKLGVTLAFDAQNAAGGIRGRQIVLDFRDDQYEPDLAEQAARALTNVQATQRPPRCMTTNDPTVTGTPGVSPTALDRGPDGVIAFLGNVGTPTMVRAAPVSLETGTIFFGAFTGATTILRDTSAGACSRYVFNVRASYADEARATLEYFFLENVPDYHHLLSFDQNDSFGQAGYSGLVAAYTAIKGGFDPVRRSDQPDYPVPVHAQRHDERARAGPGRGRVPRAAARRRLGAAHGRHHDDRHVRSGHRLHHRPAAVAVRERRAADVAPEGEPPHAALQQRLVRRAQRRSRRGSRARAPSPGRRALCRTRRTSPSRRSCRTTRATRATS